MTVVWRIHSEFRHTANSQFIERRLEPDYSGPPAKPLSPCVDSRAPHGIFLLLLKYIMFFMKSSKKKLLWGNFLIED